MELPVFPPLSDDTLRAILDRHGIGRRRVERLPDIGIFNAIFGLGDDLVLRIPRDHPAFVAAARKEARAVPHARACAVSTPRLLAFDDSLALLPVPYGIYERVEGVNLEASKLEPEASREVYRSLGRDLAKLHAGTPRAGAVAELEIEAMDDPDTLLAALVDEGYLGGLEGAWLTRWLAELASPVDAPVEPVFLHGDIQMSNLMVGEDGRYLALLDWGASGWGDPAFDFAGVPLRAVPSMLQGYRGLRDSEPEEALERRILHRHLQLALYLLRRSPQPGRSWAERPQAMMFEVFRFFLHEPGSNWPGLRPPR